MSNPARSLNAYQGDVRKANRSVSLEMASVVSFLMGLVLAMFAVWLLAMIFVSSVVPEDRDPWAGDYLPHLDRNPWLVAIGVLVFVIPATVLMLAGVVTRYFFEKSVNDRV